MFLEEVKCRTLLAPVPDDYGRASDDFSLIALGVKLAQTSIFTQLHVVWYSQKGNLMFLAQSLNKLFVCCLVTVLSQDAQKSLRERKKTQYYPALLNQIYHFYLFSNSFTL